MDDLDHCDHSDVAHRIALLCGWIEETKVMHIGHHKVASRYAKQHCWLGCCAVGFSAIVGSAVFVSLGEETNVYIKIATGAVSLFAAFLMAVQTFLNREERAADHVRAATRFACVRRKFEEEKARLRDGIQRVENYSELLNQWKEAIEAGPPLPQRVHDKVKKDFEKALPFDCPKSKLSVVK